MENLAFFLKIGERAILGAVIWNKILDKKK
jgi:hypothetical protein